MKKLEETLIGRIKRSSHILRMPKERWSKNDLPMRTFKLDSIGQAIKTRNMGKVHDLERKR